MTREHVIPFVEVLLQDTKCQEALDTIVTWRRDNPKDLRNDDTPPYPNAAHSILLCFSYWFAYKQNLHRITDINWMTTAELLAEGVAWGDIQAGDHVAMNAYMDAREKRFAEVRKKLRK